MLLWDVRTAMEEKEARTIQGILDKNKSKNSYYIMVHPNWTGPDMEVMKTTYMLLDKKPPEMLGTKLYLVDNKKGTVTKEWELPLDVLVPTECLDVHNTIESVHNSAKSVAPVICVS